MKKQKSLKAHVEETTHLFLTTCGFKVTENLLNGLILVIDSIAFYAEEGRVLFPEIFIFQNQKEHLFKYLTGERREEIFSGIEISIDNFKRILKSIAPLSTNGWTCYFEILPDNMSMNAGIVSVSENETALTFVDQVTSFINDGGFECSACFISNIGNRTVFLNGAGDNKFFISFSLSEAADLDKLMIPELSKNLLSIIDDPKAPQIESYLNRLFAEMLRGGHGNLIGVIENKPDVIRATMEVLDGVFLLKPIDLFDVMKLAFNSMKVEDHYTLLRYSIILKNMMSVDGIIVFTNDLKILGFNLFIKPEILNKETSGGARSRAFAAMEKSKIFTCGFFKSQDGNEKIFNR